MQSDLIHETFTSSMQTCGTRKRGGGAGSLLGSCIILVSSSSLFPSSVLSQSSNLEVTFCALSLPRISLSCLHGQPTPWISVWKPLNLQIRGMTTSPSQVFSFAHPGLGHFALSYTSVRAVLIKLMVYVLLARHCQDQIGVRGAGWFVKSLPDYRHN